jgi:hypothetical protein
MTNIQVTHDLWFNSRSESQIIINPNNPQEMVAASKKFKDIYNYYFTIATAYSLDGGYHWKDSEELKISGWAGLTDPALAWDDIGNAFLIGLAYINPPKIDAVGIAVYKSTDKGATWSEPKLIHTSKYDDKQWAAADHSSPDYHGRIYVAWDDDMNSGGIRFARTLDHGKSWIGTGADMNPTTNPAGSILDHHTVTFPEINVAPDGTIYIAWLNSFAKSINMLVSKDGGGSFTPSKKPPATGITLLEDILEKNHDWPVFPGGSFRVSTLPTACTGPLAGQVMVAWADGRENVSRIYYARSEDGGDSWITGDSGQPLLKDAPANQQHFHPQIVMRSNGIAGCAFYEFGPKPVDYLIDVIMAVSTGGETFSRHTVTDQPWNPAKNAPYAHYSEPPYVSSDLTFIGDYFGLDATKLGFFPLWTDTRTDIQELWVDIPKTVAAPSEPGTVTGSPAPLPQPPNFEEWIVGLINDAGGWIIPGGPKPGPPKPVPPPPFDLIQDVLLGLANYRIGTLVRGEEGRALQKAALNSLVSMVRNRLQPSKGEK